MRERSASCLEDRIIHYNRRRWGNVFYNTTLPFAERGQKLTKVLCKSAFRDAIGVVHRPLATLLSRSWARALRALIMAPPLWKDLLDMALHKWLEGGCLKRTCGGKEMIRNGVCKIFKMMNVFSPYASLLKFSSVRSGTYALWTKGNYELEGPLYVRENLPWLGGKLSHPSTAQHKSNESYRDTRTDARDEYLCKLLFIGIVLLKAIVYEVREGAMSDQISQSLMLRKYYQLMPCYSHLKSIHEFMDPFQVFHYISV